MLFDNERGKGDHKHIREVESPYHFRGPGAGLLERDAAGLRADYATMHVETEIAL